MSKALSAVNGAQHMASAPTAGSQKRTIGELDASATMEEGKVFCVMDAKWCVPRSSRCSLSRLLCVPTLRC